MEKIIKIIMNYLQSSQHSYSLNDVFGLLKIVAGAYLLYAIYDKFFAEDDTTKNAKKNQDKIEEEKQKEIAKLQAKILKYPEATLDAVEIVSVAGRIYSAYADNVITDEDSMLQAIRRLGTQTDYELVSEAFGLKPLPKWYPVFFGRKEVNLTEWLGMLDDDLQGAINHHFNRRKIRLI